MSQKEAAKKQIGQLAKSCAALLDAVNLNRPELASKICKDLREIVDGIEGTLGR